MVYIEKKELEEVWIRRENYLANPTSYKLILYKNNNEVYRFEDVDDLNLDYKFYTFNLNTLELADGQYKLDLCGPDTAPIDYAIIQVGNLEQSGEQYETEDKIFEYNPK